MNFVKEKKNAAFLSIVSNTSLIMSKFIVGSVSGSVSILSEAVHSFGDLLASCIAFYSVKKSSEPADIDHPFGHGKYEDLSGLFEGLLIFAAAFYIIHEAVLKILNGTGGHINTNAGVAVMLFSVIVNIYVSRHLFKIGHKTQSLALIADAEHLRTDIYTSAGILIALIAIKLTGITLIDPIIAILVALFIIKTAFDLCFKAIKNLLDSSLPEEERIIITELIRNYIPNEIKDIQQIKTRRSGAERIVELTLLVHENLTIKEGHALCDRIEEDIENKIGNSDVTIHLEPCNLKCTKCTNC